MGSRLKQNPEQTFYWFFEATCPVARDKDPGVLFQFPEDFNDEESCQTLPRFCFPYDIQRARDGAAVQHFTFVLTDIEGCQRFGFCRLTNSTHTCLCILSYLPWFEVFYKLLNNLADYLAKGQTNEMKALLAALYKQSIPLAAGSVTLQMVPYFIAPDPRSLPSIPENRNLTELIVAVDVSNLLQLYASMLFERRILIFASKLSTLTSCVHALSAVLYPMFWQHIFIPVLPPHLLDYCCAPMPYLIGVHTSLSERVRSRGLEEVVILNVDTNTLETPFDDLKKIPSDVMSGLKVCLKRQAVTPGCGVSKAFLKAQALLFGGYRDALQSQQEGELWFNEELFLDHKSSSMRQFLQSAVHLQFFKQFIDGRLDILNKGKQPDDLFEEEILNCETTAGRGKSYQHLVGNLKKGGGALILNMRSKANIKAKGLAKTGLKNLLIHKPNNEGHALQRGGSVSHRRAQSDCLQNRLPITQHFGMSRPRRPVNKHRAPKDEEGTKDSGDTWDGAVSEPVVGLDSELQKDEDDEEDSLLCDSEEMDLLGEIFDTLSSRSLHERGLLYGTRSLDLFGSDSYDYITKVGYPANPSQESLNLSVSGSGSLHSWNLEITEEQSDQMEDPDWLNLDTGVPEEDGTESLQAEIKEQESSVEQEDINTSTNRKEEETDEDRPIFKEVELNKEKMIFKRESLGEDGVKEMSENLEEEEEKNGYVQNQSKKDEEEEMKKEPHDMQNVTRKEEEEEKNDYVQNQSKKDEKEEMKKEPHDMQKDVLRKEEEEEKNDYVQNQSKKDEKEEMKKEPHDMQKDLTRKEETETQENKLTNLLPHHPNPEAPAAQDKTREEAVKKVLSAVARFQFQEQSQSFQLKSRTRDPNEPGRVGNRFQGRGSTQTHLPCGSNTSEEKQCSEKQGEEEEEEQPPIKVSELKKRFEG
ncbi:DENN domain-containing protein 1B isoform X3 [Cheilinus undulatus]|uniref:DENN domain-containing protein 1B isoform X3 n=1 Tax=Cheilinus undulatus TaxID=241271 RepID=UPI001BD4A144|nr:DENN domain-containing protein 1B isoform X3 [Cheilinus undulatus]